MLSLPTNSKDPWVPEIFRKYYEQIKEHAAWYSGDAGELTKFYSSGVDTPKANGRFWAENVRADDNRTVVHVPLAGDIATFSADLLFSEPPSYSIAEAHETDKEGNPIEGRTTERAKAAEERMQTIIKEGGVNNRLLEAAETAAGMGGVFLKPTWDLSLADHPILTIAQPDNAIPEFKYGYLTSVIFHKIVRKDDKGVYRLLELYVKGWIHSALYVGDDMNIGSRIPLTFLNETKDIPPDIDLKMPEIGCVYIPNKRPHKRFRGSNLGMADIQGLETMMDALDLTMSSWMRDIALGRGRVFIADDMIDESGSVDFGKEGYVRLDIDSGSLPEGEKGITATQFQIRTDEHEKTASELIANIIHMAGFSPQSFGLNQAGNISTESHEIRERKTLITKQKKEEHFKEGVEKALHLMLKIDALHLDNDTPTEFKPSASFSDTLGHDITAVSKTVEVLTRARAISIETRVRMVYPDWSDEKVKEEVGRIRSDEGMNAEDPITIGGKTY